MNPTIRNGIGLSVLLFLLVFVARNFRPTPPPSPAVIVGRLIDGFDHPLVGATATILNSGYGASTNASGEFSLDYAPGAFSLQIGARNCILQEIPLTISSPVRYVLGTKKLLCLPDPSPGHIVIQGRERFYTLVSFPLAVRQVTQPGRWGVQCTSTFIEADGLPTFTGNALVSWVPPQTVEPLADHNFVLARANGTLLDSEGFSLGMGPACTGISNPTGERSRAIYGSWMPHHAEHLASGTYCFIRGARYQMPIAQAGEGLCFRWISNPNENLGPVLTASPPEHSATGQTAEGHAAEDDGERMPPECDERADGKIPCSERCYSAHRRWNNSADPDQFLAQQEAAGECFRP